MTKKCKCCNEEKHIDDYPAYKMNKHGPYFRNECKKCRSIKAAGWRYKLSFDEVKKLKETKNCEICNIDLKWSDRYIDHNHVNGNVRGILCPRCNSTLELFEQSKHLIEPSFNYLKKYGYNGGVI
jgi:hypothetical protein